MMTEQKRDNFYKDRSTNVWQNTYTRSHTHTYKQDVLWTICTERQFFNPHTLPLHVTFWSDPTVTFTERHFSLQGRTSQHVTAYLITAVAFHLHIHMIQCYAWWIKIVGRTLSEATEGWWQWGRSLSFNISSEIQFQIFGFGLSMIG